MQLITMTLNISLGCEWIETDTGNVLGNMSVKAIKHQNECPKLS